MGQQIVPPLEYFRTQKTAKTDETLRVMFNTLIQAYDTAYQGYITDSKTIRLIARQFEAIADNPEAKDIFPYDAGRAAAALYNWALDIDMRAKANIRGQASHTIRNADIVEPVSETSQTTDVNSITENTTEKIKPLDRPIQFVDNAQVLDQSDTKERDKQIQKRIEENLRMAIIPEKTPTDSGPIEHAQLISEKSTGQTGIFNQWTAILKFIEIAEEEGKELAEKGVVKGPIDHNDIWNDWE